MRLPGSTIVLSGEYLRMQDTFSSLFGGLVLAALLIYFLMVGLDKSFVVPLSVISIVPLCLVGILPMLYFTGTAVNVQSLLGFIFIVGIKVANSVLMTDYAQELRRHEGLTPIEAIRKAAALRVRPITMTALAAFFAMIPGALALERGSEANAPLARAILGGLLAGEPATLFVLPVIYTLLVRDSPKQKAERAAGAGMQSDNEPIRPEEARATEIDGDGRRADRCDLLGRWISIDGDSLPRNFSHGKRGENLMSRCTSHSRRGLRCGRPDRLLAGLPDRGRRPVRSRAARGPRPCSSCPRPRPRLEALAMEVKDSRFPLLTELKTGVDPRRMLRRGRLGDPAWAASPSAPSSSIVCDLLRDNAPIMVEHGRAINQVCRMPASWWWPNRAIPTA